MWKRIELHNHTMESDGSMTVKELAAFMEAQGIPWFSLKDHNTCLLYTSPSPRDTR